MEGGVCGLWWHLSTSQVHHILLGRPEPGARGGGGLRGGPGGRQSLALPEKSVPNRDEVGGDPTPAMRFGSGLSVFVQKTLIN